MYRFKYTYASYLVLTVASMMKTSIQHDKEMANKWQKQCNTYFLKMAQPWQKHGKNMTNKMTNQKSNDKKTTKNDKQNGKPKLKWQKKTTKNNKQNDRQNWNDQNMTKKTTKNDKKWQNRYFDFSNLWLAKILLRVLDAGCFCVAGAALGAPQFRFAWQVLHLEHLSVILRGRCSTWRTSVFFCVAGAPLELWVFFLGGCFVQNSSFSFGFHDAFFPFVVLYFSWFPTTIQSSVLVAGLFLWKGMLTLSYGIYLSPFTILQWKDVGCVFIFPFWYLQCSHGALASSCVSST